MYYVMWCEFMNGEMHDKWVICSSNSAVKALIAKNNLTNDMYCCTIFSKSNSDNFSKMTAKEFLKYWDEMYWSV